MTQNTTRRLIFFTILVLALSLRLGLALVNREANDEHMVVIRPIITSHQLSSKIDCRECFQPKLFYFTAALLLQGTGITDNNAQIVFVQLMNFLAGLITLAVAWRFIRKIPANNEHVKLIAFALVALNPKFIAINSQASNDTFVILFCTLALYFTYHFLMKPVGNLFWPIILFIVLAVSSKANGWVTFIAILLCLLLTVWITGAQRKRLLVYTSAFLICVILFTILNPLSQVVSNYQDYGSPLVNNREKAPFPNLFSQTTSYKKYYFRPGIVSIQDGFFTFKFTNLMQSPLLTNGQFDYPPHRTSFWTLLYADSYSLHFQNWPESWQTTGTENFNLTRTLFVLGLLPTLILIAGFFLDLHLFLKGFLKRDRLAIGLTSNALFLAVVAGHLLFQILYALLFRDFGFIKLIFILPGLLAFVWLFLRGADWLVSRFRFAQWLLTIWTATLLAFYIGDVASMIRQLYFINIHF